VLKHLWISQKPKSPIGIGPRLHVMGGPSQDDPPIILALIYLLSERGPLKLRARRSNAIPALIRTNPATQLTL
jgi:hypothetical protein